MDSSSVKANHPNRILCLSVSPSQSSGATIIDPRCLDVKAHWFHTRTHLYRRNRQITEEQTDAWRPLAGISRPTPRSYHPCEPLDIRHFLLFTMCTSDLPCRLNIWPTLKHQRGIICIHDQRHLCPNDDATRMDPRSRVLSSLSDLGCCAQCRVSADVHQTRRPLDGPA